MLLEIWKSVHRIDLAARSSNLRKKSLAQTHSLKTWIQQRLKRKIHTKSTIECNYSMLSNARRCRFAVRRNASHNGVKLFMKLNSPF